MDPGAGNGHDRALLMATSARFQWPSPRGFVSAYAQNLMAADSLRHFDDAGPWDTEAVWTRFDSVLATSGGFFVEANGLIFDARRGS